MRGNPLNSARTLSSQLAQIIIRDTQLEELDANYRLSKILADWMTSKQDKNTGFWGKDESLSSDNLDALYEIVSIYNQLGQRLSNTGVMIDNIIAFITAEADESLNISDLASAWIALSSVSENLNIFIIC